MAVVTPRSASRNATEQGVLCDSAMSKLLLQGPSAFELLGSPFSRTCAGGSFARADLSADGPCSAGVPTVPGGLGGTPGSLVVQGESAALRLDVDKA